MAIAERLLGQTGVTVSRLTIGTGAFSEAGAPKAGANILIRGTELGATTWDTANNYDTYREIRLALQRLEPATRNRVVIISKIEAKTRLGAQRQVERALRHTGRDWIDVLLLHYVREPLTRWDGAIEYLVRAKRRGLVRAIGISTHDARWIRQACLDPRLAVILGTLNQDGLWLDGGTTRDEMRQTLEIAYYRGYGIGLLKVLGSGALVRRRAEAIRWAAAHPFAHTLIIGVDSIPKLEENARMLNYLSVERGAFSV